MEEQKVSRAIIVVRNTITSFAKNIIKGLATRNLRVEYFRDAELQVYFT